MIVNLGSGGGSKATGVCGIKASWPEGMKCVVSSGTKKIRAAKDATEWIFMLPFAGEWTVTAGELSKTVSVAEGEIKEVKLSEGLRLLSKGVEINETLTGLLVGTTQKQSSSYTGTAPNITRGDGFITASLTKGSGNTSGGLMFNNTIDLSIYDTLHIRVTELTGAPTVWIGASKTSAFNSTSTTAALSVSDDLEVDISSLTGLKAVGFRFAMTAAGTQSVTVADMWLTSPEGILVLYNSGDQHEDVTGGWTVSGSASLQSGYINCVATAQKQANAYTTDLIDLAPFTTLHVTITNVITDLFIGVPSSIKSTVDATQSGASHKMQPTKAGTHTLDISSLNESRYVWFGNWSESSNSFGARVTAAWLT